MRQRPVVCKAACFLQARCKSNYLNNKMITPLKNLRIYATHVLNKCYPSTLCMAGSNIIRWYQIQQADLNDCQIALCCAQDNLWVKKVLAPSKTPIICFARIKNYLPHDQKPWHIKFKKSCCFDLKKISQVPCFNNHFIFFILKIARGCETISSQQEVQVSCLESIILSHFLKGNWMGIF